MAYLTRGKRVRVALIKLAAAALASALLVACGGGGVSIGGGQGPDPVVLDIPIAYVQRPLPVNGQGQLITSHTRLMRPFNIGADLFIRDRARRAPLTPISPGP